MLHMEKKFDKRMLESTSDYPINDTELLLKSIAGYGTLPLPKHIKNGNHVTRILKKSWLAIRSERLLALTVIIFGIAATFTSTFYNILDINGLDQFWSPCIRNISLSYVLIPK